MSIITDTMKVIKTEKKGKHLNTVEEYHIHIMNTNGLHMNDMYSDVYNMIFKAM